MLDAAGLEILTEDQCVRLLTGVPIGRIVFVDRALPAIQPVNFVVDRRSVVIRTAEHSRLAIAATDTVVAFEADEFSESPMRKGWSVVALGLAGQVTDDADIDAVHRLGLVPWDAGANEYYLRIAMRVITGRRVPLQG